VRNNAHTKDESTKEKGKWIGKHMPCGKELLLVSRHHVTGRHIQRGPPVPCVPELINLKELFIMKHTRTVRSYKKQQLKIGSFLEMGKKR